MRFSTLSVALAVLITSHLTLAAPAGVNFTAREPLAERDLMARQTYSGKATLYSPKNECQIDYPLEYGWAAVSAKQWVYGDVKESSCRRYIDVYSQGKIVRAHIADRCDDCPSGHIKLSDATWRKLAGNHAGSIEVQWQYS
ncbi:hypothetical protein OPQ81_003228 [Rhizoctonia solani]|nr:hypothetical protein OPQ81_003228 [Rhizoctonia solani]